MTTLNLIRLGSTGLRVSEIGIGTWSWGDRAWGYGDTAQETDVRGAFGIALGAGVNFFDTAEVYGNGESERLLGSMVREHSGRIFIGSKFAPHRSRVPGWRLRSALRRTLSRLGRESLDLYQIHWYNRLMSPRVLARELASAVRDGLVRAVGVSNYGADQMRRFHDELARYGVPLASNQVEYSLLCRKPESDGVLGACRELGVALIAYSPLAMGVLTGKYSSEQPPPGFRRERYPPEYLKKTSALLGLMREIGSAHGGKTPSQVALNWLTGKAVLPIPGAKDAHQAAEIVGSVGWSMTSDEANAMEKAGDAVQR